jgi:pyrimidine-nucleoside phosphorylase
MTGPSFADLIERKRDGHALTAEEIAWIVHGFTTERLPVYQMSAWLMAVYFQGLNREETAAMTSAMVASGEAADLSAIDGVKVDKHSTGGVADTTTLVVAPLVASCGVPVAKLSGRGLGHTGGTLDKLEAIPGFRVALGAQEFVGQVRRIGIAVAAQSASMDPADKRIYALRDVTATVPSRPLITSSVMSKKIVGGADAILLDVKTGSGAFMKSLIDAYDLAEEMVWVGRRLGRSVRYVISAMDQPLGHAVGNALEVAEAVDVLRGGGGGRLRELCCVLAAEMVLMGGVAGSDEAARAMVESALDSGDALERFRDWVAAQGGDARVADDLGILGKAKCSRVIAAPRGGWIASFDTWQVGRAAMVLGAGREAVDDAIDPNAGLVLDVSVGDHVAAGSPIATLYAAEEALLDRGEALLSAALSIGEAPVVRSPLILGRGGSSMT